jgi:hypothetical protein
MSDDGRDSRLALRILFGLSALATFAVALLVMATMITVPAVSPWLEQTFNSGIGLKTSAIIAAVASVVVLVAFAVAAGDGLIGEIQFMISGFFLFFIFFWLLIAWVF